MKALGKLAWRNIWRNKRRTVVTTLAIAFGIFLIVVMRGVQMGTFAQMVDVSVRRGAGHLEVQRNGYWDERALKYAFPVAEADTGSISALPHVQHVSTKLAVDALVGAGEENTTGAQVVGVIPSHERAMTIFPDGVMEKGEFLSDTDTTGAVIGYAMARNLRADLGDQLAIFTQARDGSMGATLLTVRGIFHVGEPDMDGYLVLAHLRLIQDLLEAPGRATAIALTVDDIRAVESVKAALERRLRDGTSAPAGHVQDWDVMSWETLLPGLSQTIQFKNASRDALALLLLVVIAFGILNTILMGVMERYHEFGVLRAVGMRRRSLAAMIFAEAGMLSAVGLLIGNACAYALTCWWQRHPIAPSFAEVLETYGFVPVITAVPDLTGQLVWSIVVLGMVVLLTTWPAWVAMRFRPVEAIRQV